MLDCGIVLLVNSDPSVQSIIPGGGFPFGELPKNACLPNWTYRWVGGRNYPTLLGNRGYGSRRLEIACYGASPNVVVNLSNAIDWVLDGFTGNLPDGSPGTIIDTIFSTNMPIDFFDGGTRSYRRLLEYLVTYYPSGPGE